MKSPGRVWRDQEGGRVERGSERERMWKQRGVWGATGEMAGTIFVLLSGCEGATRVIA